MLGFDLATRSKTLGALIQEKLGHVLYKAAYDVLSAQSPKLTDHGSNNLLASTLDFLSTVVNTRLDDEQSEDMMTSASEEHVLRRMPRSTSITDHRSKRSTVDNVPLLASKEQNFMHDFVPFSGVGNREDIEIQRMVSEQVNTVLLSRPVAWRYIRFNSTNYVLSHQVGHFMIWPLPIQHAIGKFLPRY